MSGEGLASATRYLVLALSLLFGFAAPIAVAAVIACSIALARRRALAPA